MTIDVARPRLRSVRHVDRGVLFLLLAFVLLLPTWTSRLYAVDSVQYFSYLPSLLFDRDLEFRDEYSYFDQLNPQAGIAGALLHKSNPTTGRLPNVAPIGAAVLWSPAYLLAHGVVLLQASLGGSIVPDGLGQPYIWAVCAASTLYGIGGLLLSYAIARRWSGRWAAAASVIVCWLATPVLFYTYISSPWSHAPAMFATALFVWYWLRMRTAPSLPRWLILGLLGGLMTLCREQLVLWLLLPALDALFQYIEALRSRDWAGVGHFLQRHLAFAVTFGLTLVPQILVYVALNGRFGPSTDVEGKLRWYSPHFFDTLVDPAHGAFSWTPVWLLGLVGLLLLWRRDRRMMLLLLAGWTAQVYINGSLDTTWHLTASFGFRRLIEATPLFVLGIALGLDRLRWPRPLVVMACGLLIAWNFGLIMQWSLPPRPIRDGLAWEGMLTRQVEVAGKTVRQLPTLLNQPCKYVENGRC